LPRVADRGEDGALTSRRVPSDNRTPRISVEAPRPSHPTRKAHNLKVGIVLVVFLLAVVSTFGSN